jgi:hypothetical protein
MRTFFKPLAMLSLFLVSNIATAEWTPIANTTSGESFVDQATLRRNGNSAKIRVLNNYAQKQLYEGKPFLSGTSEFEFNCKTEKFRTLNFQLYAGPMQTGKTIFDSGRNVDSWDPLVPGTAAAIIAENVCKKN